jgi:catechol 2,3-dioxygenase-like lactoylglutathione lyase family enzyme
VFDHVTLRVPDLAVARSAFTAVLDELEVEQTSSTPAFSVWGNFALTQTDEEHPIARGVHIAFIAPTPAHVDRFARAGISAGFADDGPAGPRPQFADDYYAAFLKDRAGNSFEAVHRDGERPAGNIDHVAIRVSDIEASATFYSTIGNAAGLAIRQQTADRAAFSVGASDGSFLVIAGEPTRNVTLRSRAKTTTYAGSTRTRPLPDTAATVSRVSAPATTTATTPRSCSTPTATTSKSSITTVSEPPSSTDRDTSSRGQSGIGPYEPVGHRARPV